MTPHEVRTLLEHALAPHWRKVEQTLIDDLARGFQAWHLQQLALRDETSQPLLLAHYLLAQVLETQQLLHRLKKQYGEFTKRYSRATLPEEKQRHILDYAAVLGANALTLNGDKKAFDRWFGNDAMTDRYLNRVALAERRLALCLQRLGAISGLALAQAASPAKVWEQLALEEQLATLLSYDGDHRVRIEAFRCLANALQEMPAAEQHSSINDFTQQYVFRAATDPRQQVWIQCEALNLLATLSIEAFAAAASRRLERPRQGDDLFVRRRVVMLIGEMQHEHPDLTLLLLNALNDPSPYVRQAIAAALALADEASLLKSMPVLLLQDAIPQVRAAAMLQLPALLARPTLALPVRDWLTDVLVREHEPFPMRIALTVVTQCLQHLPAEGGISVATWAQHFSQHLESVHLHAQHLPTRRYAAMAGERLWCLSDPRRATLLDTLQQLAGLCRPGHSIRVPGSCLQGWEEAEIGRIMAVLSQNDFGLDLERTWRGWRLWRGHIFKMRLWRLLHELRHPSPDKRQAFSHTVGRVFYGRRRAASSILAELAETKVPGEPLQHSSEAGWRPYLPLVDEFISALDQTFRAQPVYIHCAEGATQIDPPSHFLGRLLASLRLTWKFEHYARLRNWHEDSQQAPDAYLRAMTELGFKVRFRPNHATAEANVTRFFPAGFLLTDPQAEWWARLHNYFFSVFENTLAELSLFTALAIIAFIARHLYLNRQIRVARSRIPLVVGGWGTRGKSGTERIKAALFNALGYSVISKTTGCEAMFLHGPAYGQLREMFLFRPYDKATIWEQHNVVRLAEKLGGEVFLWECMALTPAFVQLLQRSWMRDDFSTMTNTFPDHEDLQGPAGINIPEVMTNFIPERGRMLTSEEQMRPILEVAARDLATPLRGVGWIESGLLAPDILARFPYQEHPDNIALVLALADELGIQEDFALKEMADRVVPDLGVLKIYPAAPVETRMLEFVNGMSANERFGCLGNWQRTGFATHDMVAEPGVMLTAVVNNRADRIARSRVFAGILVEDIRTDLIVLIGSNLHGLQGYIREAWVPHAASLSLWPADGTPSEKVLERIATDMRVAHSESHAKARLEVMLLGCGVTQPEPVMAQWHEPEILAQTIMNQCGTLADTIIACAEHDRRHIEEYTRFQQRIATAAQSGTRDAALDQDFRALLWQWLERRILVVEDPYASGNQIISLICQATPPGFRNRIQGIQNIKGTGLDFVYRWQAWDTCHKACTLLQSSEPEQARQGLAALSSFQEFGLLCDEPVQRTIAQVKESTVAQNEHFQSELTIITSRLERTMQEIRSQMSATRTTGWLEKIFAAIEAFLDAGDAVKRRKMANRIYQDLITERISHARAALELQGLNKRQKGGWLMSTLMEWHKRWP